MVSTYGDLHTFDSPVFLLGHQIIKGMAVAHLFGHIEFSLPGVDLRVDIAWVGFA